ncbi:helix-turn-helix transcriptional regulator [Microbacteriaceae bacterium 4G12]
MAETTSRVLALLGVLQTHRQWTGPELARRLGVTERTLRRDVERLRALGYRVEATRGAAGGYRLEAASDLPPLLFTAQEAVTVAVGLRLAAAQGLSGDEQTTTSALAKFEQVLPAALRERVNALAGAVTAQPGRRAPVSPDLLGALALACRDHERIRFHYLAGTGEETRRLVEPHALVAAQRDWFLVCWDPHRGDWRTFRVDRIHDLAGTRLRFEPRELPAADAAQFLAAATAELSRTHTAWVVMDLPLDRMRERFGPWAAGARAEGEGHTRWPIGGRSTQELLDALVWVPEGVSYEVQGAPELVAAMRETAGRMLEAAERSSGGR